MKQHITIPDTAPDACIESSHLTSLAHHDSDGSRYQDSVQPTDRSTVHNRNSSDDPMDGSSSRLDGGYGWVIVASEFLIFFVTGSILGSQAMFYPAFREAFDVNSETVGWFIALARFTQALSSLLCGSIVDRYGSRKVCLCGCLLQSLGMFISAFSPNINLPFITYSLIWGPGLGFIYTSCPVITQKWFTKNRSLAHSLSIIGIPCGMTASGPLTYALLENYSWRGALLIYSGIGLHGLLSACLFRPPPKTVKEKVTKHPASSTKILREDKNHILSNQVCHLVFKLIDVTLFRNPAFVLFFLARTIVNFAFHTNNIHLPSRALAMGMPENEVQFLPIFIGVSAAIGAVSSGAAGRKGNLAALMGVGMGFHGIFQICLGFTGKNFIWNAVCTSGSNFMVGFFLALEPTLITNIVGIHRLGRAYGLYCLILSISALTTAPFSGWMYDISGNYNIPFYVTGALAVVAGLLMFVVVSLSSFYAKNTEE